MHGTLLAAIGITSGGLNIIGLVPYVRDIFRHKTKPERAMWWIYAGLFFMLGSAQFAAGGHWLVLVTATYAFSSFLIAVLSVRYGYGSFHKRDMFSVAVALLGLGLWLITDRPLLAIIMVIIVDFAGFWLTLVKTWHAPHSETLISWQLSLAAAVLSVVTAGTWSFVVLIYPIYAVVFDGLLVWEIIYRRRKITKDSQDF